VAMLDLYDMTGTDIGAGVGKDAVGLDVAPYEEIVAIAIVNENAVDTGGRLQVSPGTVDGWYPIGDHTTDATGVLRGQGCLFMCQPSEVGFPVTAASCMVKLRAVFGDV